MSVIYLDMDGVLANFFEKFAEYFDKPHWKQIPNKLQAIEELKGTDFFYTLLPFENTQELVYHVRKVAEENDLEWGINSSPLRGDRDNSAYHKRRWLEKYGIADHLNIENLIFTGQKENYATETVGGMPNILIDDKPSNIQKWEAKGGIGIRYQANKDSLDYLKDKLKAAIYKLEDI